MQKALRLPGLPLHDWRPNALGVDGQGTWEYRRMTPVRHNGITDIQVTSHSIHSTLKVGVKGCHPAIRRPLGVHAAVRAI